MLRRLSQLHAGCCILVIAAILCSVGGRAAATGLWTCIRAHGGRKQGTTEPQNAWTSRRAVLEGWDCTAGLCVRATSERGPMVGHPCEGGGE